MTRDLWCWRCRKVVPMLEPHEWGIVEAARAAGAQYLTVIEGARARLAPSHDFTPPRRHATVGSQRLAPFILSYELFTGLRVRALEIPHHRTSLYGPLCVACGKPQRTPVASWCAACGQPRETEPAGALPTAPSPCAAGQVQLHTPRLGMMTIDQVLAGPLPPLERGIIPDTPDDVFLFVLADPALGLVNHDLTFRLAAPTEVPSEPARMVQGLFSFRLSVLGDALFDYLCEGDDGNQLPDVVRWCEAIGAVRAQSFAQAVLDLYPADLRTDPRGRSDNLDELDDHGGFEVLQRFAETRWDDVLEIPARLRQFVQAHLTDFEQALEQGRTIRHFGDEAVLRFALNRSPGT
jgi:hypothetical protein